MGKRSHCVPPFPSYGASGKDKTCGPLSGDAAHPASQNFNFTFIKKGTRNPNSQLFCCCCCFRPLFQRKNHLNIFLGERRESPSVVGSSQCLLPRQWSRGVSQRLQHLGPPPACRCPEDRLQESALRAWGSGEDSMASEYQCSSFSPSSSPQSGEHVGSCAAASISPSGYSLQLIFS